MLEVKNYKKKPVVIQAVQFTGKNGSDLESWSEGKIKPLGVTLYPPFTEGDKQPPTHTSYLEIPTLEGVLRADPGSYIIKGVKGEFYPVRKDIFEETYEQVS